MVGALGVSGYAVSVTPRLRDLMRATVGIVLGTTFTPAVLATAGALWTLFPAVAAYALVALFVGYRILLRLGHDRRTAHFTAAPGGLGEMLIVSARIGGDARVIVFSHMARFLMSLFFFPAFFAIASSASAAADGPVLDLPAASEIAFVLICLAAMPLALWILLPSGAFLGPFVFSETISASVLFGEIHSKSPPDASRRCPAASRFQGPHRAGSPKWASLR